MSREKQKALGTDAQDGGHTLARGLEAASLLGLLLIVAMRPLISESYDSSLTGIDQVTGLLGVNTPATTVTYGLFVLVMTAMAAGTRWLQQRRWEWTGLEIGWLLLLGGAIISTCVASNKRLAANASADWLITLLLLFVLPNLCRDRFRVLLVLLVVTASGMASLAKDAMQVAVELPETRAMYQEQREKFWSQQGVPLDDPRVEMYERRMRGSAASGFFPHQNSQASLLVLTGLAAAGVAGLLWQHRPARALALFVAALLLAGTALTASKGGALAAIIGAGLLAVTWWRARQGANARRIGLVLAWAACGAIGVGTLAFGQLRGGLPGASLQYRWNYWGVTLDVIRDHLLTGVGALNFGPAYLLRKPIQFPEEIKDPHNFVLSLTAQWGLLGAIGLAVLLIAGTRRVWRTAQEPAAGGGSAAAKPVKWGWAGALVPGYVALRLVMMRDFLGDGGGVVIFDLGSYGLVWALCVCGGIALARQAWSGPDSDALAFDRAAAALICGSAAFLLHNLIEFGVFHPATLTPLCAVGGVLLCRMDAGGPGSSPGRPKPTALIIGVALTALFLLVIARPVWSSASHLAAARGADTIPFAIAAYERASAADAHDPTAPNELGNLYAHMNQPDAAIAWLRKAIERDSRDQGLYHTLVRADMLKYENTHRADDIRQAIADQRVSVRLYPSSPDEHVILGDLLARAADDLHDTSAATEAAAAFQKALDLDAARPAEEEVRRWSPSRRRDVEHRLRVIRGRSTQPATTSAPGL